jgi:hypothetical protein
MLANETAIQVAQMSDGPIVILTVLLTALVILGQLLQNN